MPRGTSSCIYKKSCIGVIKRKVASASIKMIVVSTHRLFGEEAHNYQYVESLSVEMMSSLLSRDVSLIYEDGLGIDQYC